MSMSIEALTQWRHRHRRGEVAQQQVVRSDAGAHRADDPEPGLLHQAVQQRIRLVDGCRIALLQVSKDHGRCRDSSGSEELTESAGGVAVAVDDGEATRRIAILVCGTGEAEHSDPTLANDQQWTVPPRGRADLRAGVDSGRRASDGAG